MVMVRSAPRSGISERIAEAVVSCRLSEKPSLTTVNTQLPVVGYQLSEKTSLTTDN
jgi:hypothetical protein